MGLWKRNSLDFLSWHRAHYPKEMGRCVYEIGALCEVCVVGFGLVSCASSTWALFLVGKPPGSGILEGMGSVNQDFFPAGNGVWVSEQHGWVLLTCVPLEEGLVLPALPVELGVPSCRGNLSQRLRLGKRVSPPGIQTSLLSQPH